MLPITILTTALALLVLAGWIVDRWRRVARTKMVRAVGFPLRWLSLLDDGMPVYRCLPLDLRERLQEKAFAKINDLTFAGPGGVDEVTDAMRVSLGAHFGLLHARLRIPPIPTIRHVVVGARDDIEAGLAAPTCPWTHHTLVAVWDPKVGAARCLREEKDEEIMGHWRRLRPSGPAAGAADLDHLYFAGWARSLPADAPDRLMEAAAYSADLGDNEALFAAATEAFIRYPHVLRDRAAPLFEGLKRFYLFDPTRWAPENAAAAAA